MFKIVKVLFFLLISVVLIFSSISQIFALQQIAGPIVIEIKPGESKTFQWGLASDSDAVTSVELRSEGKGSEFISFTKQLSIEPRQFAYAEFTVTIPADHPGGIDLTPSLYATEFGEQGGSTVINIQMKKIPIIKIAPNENPEFRSNTAYDEKTTEQNIQTESKQELKTGQEQTKPPGETTIINPASQKQEKESDKSGGGCLIATAAFGSELAPQVQLLREIRDNKILVLSSGISFMTVFNEFYYSF